MIEEYDDGTDWPELTCFFASIIGVAILLWTFFSMKHEITRLGYRLNHLESKQERSNLCVIKENR